MKDRIDAYVNNHRQEFLDDLRTLVQIPSVAIPGSPEPNPFGPDVAKVLKKALDMAEEKGMRAENHGNWYGLAKAGQGTHTVGIFSHLDVVEVDDRWLYPPFELTILEGGSWMVGRGCNDDKLAAVIGMHTAAAMKELGIGKNLELQLYLGCCEEKGMSDLERYLAEQEQPEFSMVPDFIFPVSVSESGLLRFSLKKEMPFAQLSDWQGGNPNNGIPLKASVSYKGEKIDQLLAAAEQNENIHVKVKENGSEIEAKIEARGKRPSGFGTNDEINAILVLQEFLIASGILSETDLALTKELDRLCDKSGAVYRIFYQNLLYGNLVSTCIRQELAEDSTVMEMVFSCRVPGPLKVKTLSKKIQKFADRNGYQLEILRAVQGSMVDGADPKVHLINDCWNEVSGRSTEPRSGGGTYARKLKNAVSFGPKDNEYCPLLPPGHGWLHGPDESMDIEQAFLALRTYIRAVAALDEWWGKNENQPT